MFTFGIRDIKTLARDGGFRSRKLWAFVLIVAVSFPLAWDNRLQDEEVVLFLSLYGIYCIANLLAKFLLAGGTLRSLLTSTPAFAVTPRPAPSPSPQTPLPKCESRDESESEIERLRRENERIKEILHRLSISDTE